MSQPTPDTESKRILLTGASGYVGGRLLRELLRRNVIIRCMSRRPKAFDFPAESAGRIEPVKGDVLDRESLDRALAGVDAAYYLVHSMSDAGEFESVERRGAEQFAAAAAAAGVGRIIYLGGLGDESERLSTHLRSRHEVGRILRGGTVKTIEFRASIVLGAGSLSFDLLCALVDRLPVMVTPSWVSVPAQPIAVSDLMAYLTAALDLPVDGSRVYEIGGCDAVTYGGLMKEYARQRNLARLMIPIPVLSPRLSSLWLALVARKHARIGRKLIESIKNPTVVTDQSARDDFDIRPMGVADAMAAAIADSGSLTR